MQDPVTSFVVLLFSSPGSALWMAAAIAAAGIGLVAMSGFTRYQPLKRELLDRWNRLSAMRGRDGQREFAQKLGDLDLHFGGVGTQTPGLTQGWANYRSLLVRGDNGALSTTVRARDVFEPLDEPARALEWWANILVAVGLVITFLGIVAALSEATGAIGRGDPAAVQTALMGLLAIAATKFWTSIAGVGASIALRICARLRRRRINELEDSLYAALDSCVQFMPPEKVMMEQMQVLRRIEAALTAANPGVAHPEKPRVLEAAS